MSTNNVGLNNDSFGRKRDVFLKIYLVIIFCSNVFTFYNYFVDVPEEFLKAHEANFIAVKVFGLLALFNSISLVGVLLWKKVGLGGYLLGCTLMALNALYLGFGMSMSIVKIVPGIILIKILGRGIDKFK